MPPETRPSGNIHSDPSTRVERTGAERFHAGWRFLPESERLTLPPWLRAPRQPDISVDVVRGRDLVALTVDFFGATLATPEGELPYVERSGSPPHLMVVTFAYQHAHEQAQFVVEGGQFPPFANEYDPENPIPNPTTDPGPTVPGTIAPDRPVGYVPARASRLVFELDAEDRVEFTRAGILRAISELTPVLHPGAAPPGTRGSIDTATDPPRIFVWVTPDLVARYAGAQILLERATAADRRAQAPPDPATTQGALAFAQNIRRVRVDSARFSVARGAGLTARARLPEALGAVVVGPIIVRPRARYSTRPTLEQTAIEAPYRLVISPTVDGRWVHATVPVPAGDEQRNVELWHSRLAVEGANGPDEKDAERRIVRAIWTRDRDGIPTSVWRQNENPQENAGHPLATPEPADDLPFRGSLNRADRHRLVRQTAEQWPGISDPRSLRPVGADKLWLSSLGAWLDLHGAWYTKEYSKRKPFGYPSVLAWDHIAPLGRDQWVRVVYPGYLFPLGHPAALVKITERRVSENPAIASLFQYKFIVVSEPSRTYDEDDWCFVRADLSPRVTPTIKDPGAAQDTFFWPQLGDNSYFAFTVDTWDKDGRETSRPMPLLWVAEHFNPGADGSALNVVYDPDAKREVQNFGQKVAFTPRTDAGDSVLETKVLRVRGRARVGESTPFLSSADVVLDSARRLSNLDFIRIIYNQAYLDHGFGAEVGDANAGQLWATVLTPDVALTDRQHATLDVARPLPKVEFGKPSAGTDRAGGFVQPDLPIRGLSVLTGAVGDVAGMESRTFDPQAFFKGAFPKLFGLVDLWEIIDSVTDLANIPNLVSEAVEVVTQLVDDIQALIDLLQETAATAEADAAAAANALLAAIEGLFATVRDLLDPANPNPVSQRIQDLEDTFGDIAGQLANPTVLSHPGVPPVVRGKLQSLAGAVRAAEAAADLAGQLTRLLETFEPGDLEFRFAYEFTPKLFTRWPPSGITLISLPENGFRLAVEGRVSGQGEVSAKAMAEIRDFTLHLFGKEGEPNAAPLVRIPFENISFIAGSDGKAEVDVNLGEITFLGILSFVEVLKDFIPLDGFSDPPFLEVDPSGLKAGFTLPIPSVSVGVFNLSNISLGADVQVPFLGEAISFGFNFCTRERPFNLSVMCIGGGGWFGIRLNPKGLTVLELGLEAGVMLAVDFGVASGSISATLGIYMRLESDKGSLTGYFRLRGEVDVLGLISASIELYLALEYHFDSGKMIGTARITIEVSVLCFSGSVSIECTRQFAGSKGDPSLAEQLLEPDGSAPAWDEYWRAFALEGA
jgi:hypothetical protein